MCTKHLLLKSSRSLMFAIQIFLNQIIYQKQRTTLTKRVAVHTSVPYVKFGKKNVFVLPDFDVTFKVYLKSSNITRYFLTKICHSYMCAIRRLKLKMFDYFWRISLKIREGRSHMCHIYLLLKSSSSQMCAMRNFRIKLFSKNFALTLMKKRVAVHTSVPYVKF